MMKSVIIICLIAMSTCLADQNETKDGQPPQQIPKDLAPGSNKTQEKDEKTGKPSNEAAVPVNLTQIITNTTKENVPQAKLNETQVTNGTMQSKGNETSSVPTDSKQTKTDDKTKTQTDTKSEKDNKATPTLPANNEKAANVTTAEGNKESKANSTTNEVMKPTEATVVQARGFDGPSFIGGIILTLGLLAISFMGYKYYKNQTERNYYGTL